MTMSEAFSPSAKRLPMSTHVNAAKETAHLGWYWYLRPLCEVVLFLVFPFDSLQRPHAGHGGSCYQPARVLSCRPR